MKKFTTILLLALVAIMLFGSVTTSASEPYDTYTYSIDGKPLRSPTAYRPETVVDATDMNIGKYSSIPTLSASSDIYSDDEANIYIADTGNNLKGAADEKNSFLHRFKFYNLLLAYDNLVREFARPYKHGQAHRRDDDSHSQME